MQLISVECHGGYTDSTCCLRERHHIAEGILAIQVTGVPYSAYAVLLCQQSEFDQFLRFQTGVQNDIDIHSNNLVDGPGSAQLIEEQGLTLVTGYSFFQARDGILELGRAEENAHWMYVMLDASF